MRVLEIWGLSCAAVNLMANINNIMKYFEPIWIRIQVRAKVAMTKNSDFAPGNIYQAAAVAL